mgnify:CR=1 FL=1
MKAVMTVAIGIICCAVITTTVFAEAEITEAIEYSGIKLVFSGGRIGVYYKGLALTEGAGLDAEFCEGDELYRNTEASWLVKKKNG